MTPRGISPSGSNPKRKGSLRSQGDQQVIDLLRLADESSNADIRAAAVEIAKETSKYHRQQGARLPPTLILILTTATILSTAGVCWYALLNYPQGLAWSVCGIMIVLTIIAVGVATLLSGHLSQTHFVQLLRMCLAKIPFLKSLDPAEPLDSVSAQGEDDV